MSRIGSIGAAMAINQLNQMGNPSAANRLMFLQWLRLKQPAVYNAATKIAFARNGIAPPVSFGDVPSSYGAFHNGRRFAYNGEGLGDAITATDRKGRRFYNGEGLGAITPFRGPAVLNPARSMTAGAPGGFQGKDEHIPLMAGLTDIYRTSYANRVGMSGLADYASYTSTPSYTSDQIASMSSTPVNLDTIASQNLIPAINPSNGTVTTASEGSTPQFSASSLSSTFNSLLSVAGSVAKLVGGSSTASIVSTNAARAARGLPPLNSDGTVMTPAQLAAAGYTSAQISAMEAALAASGSTTTTIMGLPWYLWAGGAAALLFVLAKRKS